jgi:thiamine biosynthesis lipoprotein
MTAWRAPLRRRRGGVAGERFRVSRARRRRSGALQVFILLATLTPASAAVFRTGQPVMGTVLQVTIVASDDASARALAQAALAEARHWDDVLTTWRPEGELAQLNTHAGGGPVLLGPQLSSALRAMQRLCTATHGAFDPAVGAIVDLWRGPAPPTAARQESVAPRHLAAALILDGQRATLAAGAKLDAGGIGKGMALDAAAAMLRARGVEAAYLDFGGSSQLAIGAPPGAPEGWRVAVSGLAPNQMLGVLSLRDAALSTSRAAEGPSAAGPIIDPQSGRPVMAARVTTVRAADATSAEAWSKALIIRGRDGMQQARAGGLDVLLEDQDGVVRSPGFALEEFGELSIE